MTAMVKQYRGNDTCEGRVNENSPSLLCLIYKDDYV